MSFNHIQLVTIPFIARFNEGTPQILMTTRIEGDHFVTVPGGKMEGHETARQAASREIRQETGLRISPREFQPLSEYPVEFYSRKESITIEASPVLAYYKTEHGKPQRKEPDKHQAWMWTNLDLVETVIVNFGAFPPELFHSIREVDGMPLENRLELKDKVYRHGKRLHLIY